MRNLKKILALVLALVMSLSLMATAGAADFPDADQITDKYETAIEVLNGLGVFTGYKEDGTFRPQGDITRAETAAIIYRIVTGDVKNEQVGIYADYDIFTDVHSNDWFAGYVNFCANAEYIKGVGGGKFNPQGKVTGYAALAMILRAIGYTANGGFTGPSWEVQTARTAEARKITKNINTSTLGQPATRETVAEILFQAILVNMVDHNVDNTFNGDQGYFEKDITLGYKTFGLEEVTGVVVANEYAGILRGENVTTGKNPTAAGRTVLLTKDEKVYEIDTASGLEDLGETRVAYTTKDTGRDDYNIKCVALIDPDTDNVVYDNGEQLSTSAFAANIRGNENERYINFGETGGVDTTTIKVSYWVTSITRRYNALNQADAIADFKRDFHLGTTGSINATPVNHLGSGVFDVTYTPSAGDSVTLTGWADGHTYSIRSRTVAGVTTWYYVVEIQPGAEYTALDEHVVTAIFNRADLIPVNATTGWIVRGEVYRGTQSVVDYSDANNYDTFLANCISTAVEHVNEDIDRNNRGWWLKVIDNDSDGITDWVFQTRYTVAKVANVAESGTLTLDTTDWETAEDIRTLGDSFTWDAGDRMNAGRNITATNESGEDLAVGDVVYYATIDGASRAWKCDVVEGRVSSINRSALTVTMEGNETPYTQSAVHEHSISTDINSGVTNMSGTTNMKLYLDKYGYLAAFSQNITGNFALLTNGWYNNLKNGVEYAVTAWDSTEQALKQYDVTEGGVLFINNGATDNSWNNIRAITPLNNNVNGNIRTMVAYMENDGENAKLMPVDTVYDVQRQNGREIRMIDMDTTIPSSGLVTDTTLGGTNTVKIHETGTLSGLPYSGGPVTGTRVRALSNTMYYYVYQSQDWNGNQWTGNTNASGLYVKQFEGYASGANWLSTADRQFVEDVYVVGTRAEDVAGIYYTANVVVVELRNGFIPNTHKDNEQVFIYNIPTTVGWNTVEEVDVIRADGSNQKMKIDLAASRTYTEAEDQNNVMMPGLYWLHRTNRTASEDIWAVEHMHHDDIRAAGIYDVGTVFSSDFNLPNDYVQVTDWTCAGGASHHVENNVATNRHNVVGTTPTNPAPAAQNPTRRDAEGSKYYNLTYDSRNFGTVTESNAPGTLNQWATQWGATSNGRGNQVLVRYDGSGNIVYAISFDHLVAGTLNENYAQQVWRSVLLDRAKSIPDPTGVRFYGQRDTTNNGINDITVPLAKAWKYWDSYGKSLEFNSGATVTGTYPTTPVPGTYPVVITDNKGNPAAWSLTVSAAVGTGTLRYKHDDTTFCDGTGSASGTHTGELASINQTDKEISVTTTTGDKTKINDFIALFDTPDGRSIQWTFWDKQGKVIAKDSNPGWNQEVENCGGFRAVVVADNGTKVTYTSTGSGKYDVPATGVTCTVTSSGVPGLAGTHDVGEQIDIEIFGKGTFSSLTNLTNVKYDAATDKTTATYTVPEADADTLNFAADPRLQVNVAAGVTLSGYDAKTSDTQYVYYPAASAYGVVTFNVTVPAGKVIGDSADYTKRNVEGNVWSVTVSGVTATGKTVTLSIVDGGDANAVSDMVQSDGNFKHNADSSGATEGTVSGSITVGNPSAKPTVPNNINDFNTVYGNVFGGVAANKALVGVHVDLRALMGDQFPSSATSFKVKQENPALGVAYTVTSGTEGNLANGWMWEKDGKYYKEKDGYTADQLADFCFMLADGADVIFTITPNVGPVITLTVKNGVTPVAAVVTP